MKSENKHARAYSERVAWQIIQWTVTNLLKQKDLVSKHSTCGSKTRESLRKTLPCECLLLQQMLKLSDSIAARTIYWLDALPTSWLSVTSLTLNKEAKVPINCWTFSKTIASDRIYHNHIHSKWKILLNLTRCQPIVLCKHLTLEAHIWC